MKTLQAPLDRISAAARAYPVHLLREGDTGLCLFAAAFLGINDAIHMARMEMTVDCVDTDGQRLVEMSRLYPDEWQFWPYYDCWLFAHQAAQDGRTWDVVSVDTFTGEATDRSLRSLDLWCALASRVVTLTVAHGQAFDVPDGWEFGGLFERSLLASWLVLVKC